MRLLVLGLASFRAPGPNPDDTTNEALAAFGLVLEKPAQRWENKFWLWPDCQPAMVIWQRVQTQWLRNHKGNPLGLNYSGVEAALRLSGTPRKQWVELFGLLQKMETAALDALALREAQGV